ncbi:hypothetical protein GS429_03920 [Natronorubrum sp. JWXQ-INN-674]|uniref:ParB/Sulfiredoxin domain-containing protein n=1 Tax=Natronorubrum halalkaliphilum TaxID=2691917 RepID=A0A6B0VHC1_9EURY|nr:hypothetical protein [Natronorubrum halalkaliphilum]MXV61221.1 hypothetical protein [Natronorubrum halalkaliphilum]
MIDGDWDRNCGRFIDQPIPRSIHQHYKKGKPWDETPLVDMYEDDRQFKHKCERIERLYNQIERDGFEPQFNLANESPTVAWNSVNATIAPQTDEITVDIGRDGELLWNMLGKHRLSIAKALNIEHIPILVFARHSEWQAIRAQLANEENVTIPDSRHPDLRDLK